MLLPSLVIILTIIQWPIVIVRVGQESVFIINILIMSEWSVFVVIGIVTSP